MLQIEVVPELVPLDGQLVRDTGPLLVEIRLLAPGQRRP